MVPKLETERLILREIKQKDAQALFSIFSLKEVTQYYGQDTMKSVEEAENLVAMFQKGYEDKRGMRWGIELKDRPGLIGTIGFNNLLGKYKRAEVGYEIHPDFWRSGYTSEAVREMVDYGFNKLNLTRIGAVVFLENEASNNLLRKLGFQEEGILRDYIYQDGQPNDVFMYSILKSQRDDS
ncbi:GNAT family N-acetyltransferase [Mangrovibacillus cuniculi]|uniref:GNAT family N-acetyltransferase n=1 Tax=Mangrovibacillus cuniculi TaxID=2593652 RepID=A0A7S8HEM7_9BACI|nr:GNAT family protein [Mangrovibacillus cuniculi]QPC45893.1 GNAT family N-acetyltransferase [Mangrovibacillus cuniculi]